MSTSETIIHRVSNTCEQLFMDLQHGKTRACVTRSKLSEGAAFWVCCKNASHAVWRGPGKPFDDLREASSHYRSPSMKAILSAAIHLAEAEESAQQTETPDLCPDT